MQDERDISGAVERILDNDCDGGARVSQDTVRALVGLVVGERERCAGIAENIAPHFRNPMGDAIAAAIRCPVSSFGGR